MTTVTSRAREYHGMKHTPEYAIWSALKNRCLNPNDARWDSYGGRGITICEEWVDSFRAFIFDMGPRPTSGHSIERIDNSMPYSKENCRWATSVEQGRNKRNNRMLTFNGKTQCVSAWAEETGMSNKTILFRLNSGWTIEDALTRPLLRRRPQQAS
jgi:hypothetical protein